MKKGKRGLKRFFLHLRDISFLTALILVPVLIYLYVVSNGSSLIYRTYFQYGLMGSCFSWLCSHIIIKFLKNRYPSRDIDAPERYSLKFLRRTIYAITSLIIAIVTGVSLYSQNLYQDYFAVYYSNYWILLVYLEVLITYSAVSIFYLNVRKLSKEFDGYEKDERYILELIESRQSGQTPGDL